LRILNQAALCKRFGLGLISKRIFQQGRYCCQYCFCLFSFAGLNGGTGVYRSYLARAECMAHLGDQKAAILDFSAAIEVIGFCVT